MLTTCEINYLVITGYFPVAFVKVSDTKLLMVKDKNPVYQCPNIPGPWVNNFPQAQKPRKFRRVQKVRTDAMYIVFICFYNFHNTLIVIYLVISVPLNIHRMVSFFGVIHGDFSSFIAVPIS